jgi:hypothetical protein
MALKIYLTFVTGCSRQRVHLLLPIDTSLLVVLSQVCLNRGQGLVAFHLSTTAYNSLRTEGR